MGYIKGKIETEQYTFLPINFDSLIEENNSVRMLEAFVESLDMKKLKFKNAIPNEKGRPSYDPRVLLKLYLYGYLNGIRSSRKLERESKRNIELFWLLRELKPDFKTIADFRKDNIECMKGVFSEFSVLCEKLNLVGKEIVAVDGSKFRACNARRKNYTKGKLEKQIEYHKENVEKYIKLLDEVDKEEEKSEEIKITQEELKEKIKEITERIEKLTEIKEEVNKNGEISITDPDARNMKMSNNGIDICHNVQIAVDDKNDLVVAIDVTSSAADQTQLFNISMQAKEELGVEELTSLADKGYWDGENLRKCKENGITTIVSAPKEAGNIGYKKSDFKYNEENDYYICPQGKILTKGKSVNEYKNRKACKSCSFKEMCTKNKVGRIIKRGENEDILRENVERQVNNMELYKKRQMIIEHVFGTVKRALGYTHLLLKTNKNVKGESFMHFLAYNMKRVCNIKSIPEIMGKIAI